MIEVLVTSITAQLIASGCLVQGCHQEQGAGDFPQLL